MLPISARLSRWQEEIYFALPLELEDVNPSPDSSEGDVSYWSPGSAFCIFFGKSQPYSPVNHIGRVVDGLDAISKAEDGSKITLKIMLE